MKRLSVTRPHLRLRRVTDRLVTPEPGQPDPPQTDDAPVLTHSATAPLRDAPGDPNGSAAETVETPTVDTPNVDSDSPPADAEQTPRRWRSRWQRVLAFVVLPVLAIALAGGAGYLKWSKGGSQVAAAAAAQSVAMASESTVAMLTYKPDTVADDLVAASDRLTGTFKNSYLSLVRDVVIPGSQQKKISATATVPAAASISAAASHAVVLVFVNQAVTIGADTPSDTASSVKVTLDRVGGRWLISGFDPI